MLRRQLLKSFAFGGVAALPWARYCLAAETTSVSVEALPRLEGEMTLYLGRGEGGLYESILEAIQKRNPKFDLKVRRGPSAALANTIIAEAKAGVLRADVFWAVDTGSPGVVKEAGLAQKLPADLTAQLQPAFQYQDWLPISGRIRTLPYHSSKLEAAQIPQSVMALADSPLRLGWAPAYEAFQSFITAMRVLEGEEATANWLKAVRKHAKSYAGELGVVMAVERGEVDLGFANHYYTLRLKSGKPNAQVDLAFTQGDAGCLVNASSALALNKSELAVNFMRYLVTQEVQSFLASEAYEIPLIQGISPPPGLPDLTTLSPPRMDLTRLADLRPTLDLMRKVGVL